MTVKELTSSWWIFRFPVEATQGYKRIYSIVKGIIILNLLDTVFTLIWVKKGIAEEANIILKNIVNNSPVGFVFVKIVLVSFGSLLLWRYRSHPFAIIGLVFAFIIYSLVLIYHMHYVNLLFS
jgi:hypothetical protein